MTTFTMAEQGFSVCAALLVHIAIIFRMRAQKKVGWIHTATVVAGMTDA